MNSFILKIIACIIMFIDHLKYIIPGEPLFMSAIGRLAFPIFSFQLVEGYSHTKNVKKYLFRLLLFALIAQIPFSMYFETTTLNTLFTLFLGMLGIYVYEYFKSNKIIGFTFIILLMTLAELLKTDYSYYGVGIIFIFHILKNKKALKTIAFSLFTILFFILYTDAYLLGANILQVFTNTEFMTLLICTLAGIIPCLLYNGKQGPKMKYFFYLFYPLHIILLLIFDSLLI